MSIDQATPAEDWEWAGPQWRRHVRTDTVTEIDAVEIQAADPAAMAARWAEVLGGSLDEAGTTLAFDRGAVRFVPIADDPARAWPGWWCAADPARRGHVASACGTRFTFA
ncbi:MAG: hypothetical protein R2755_01925 [Acidimicrobiales bacterium]